MSMRDWLMPVTCSVMRATSRKMCVSSTLNAQPSALIVIQYPLSACFVHLRDQEHSSGTLPPFDQRMSLGGLSQRIGAIYFDLKFTRLDPGHQIAQVGGELPEVEAVVGAGDIERSFFLKQHQVEGLDVAARLAEEDGI